MTEKRNCGNCKHLSVIVSQTSDYWCSMKGEYLNLIDFKKNCIEFEKQIRVKRVIMEAKQ